MKALLAGYFLGGCGKPFILAACVFAESQVYRVECIVLLSG